MDCVSRSMAAGSLSMSIKHVSLSAVYSPFSILDLMPDVEPIPFPERIAFAIVPDEVRYPDRIVGIALLLRSTQ